jgi:hypothetical protein
MTGIGVAGVTTGSVVGTAVAVGAGSVGARTVGVGATVFTGAGTVFVAGTLVGTTTAVADGVARPPQAASASKPGSIEVIHRERFMSILLTGRYGPKQSDSIQL